MTRPKRIRSVLVANRGEIAVRVIRGLKAIGLETIAIYSDADANSLAVRLADSAARIGRPPSSESYLRIDRILDAARRHAADAVHPGYGFLSERADFAQAVEDAGLTFLGPRPADIAFLGDKLEARRLMEASGIGPAPGSRTPIADVGAARHAAAEIGFPVLLKAAAGGGGKGIRVVRGEDEIESAFRLASSEAESSFGSPLVFAERYVEQARHVEIQVLGDGRGGVRLFPERDCSIQRRLQKLVEESPSPAVTPEVREALYRATRTAVRKIRYRGPGTFEFLLGPANELHFLEVNTRIQVEHPVTEMISGVDIVGEQVRIAEGARFAAATLDEAVVETRGAAIELRINAENALDGFRPSVGTVDALHLPGGPGIRIDTALVRGTEVTPFYDPLVAKLIAGGRDRREALQRLGGALDELVITGISTTLPVGRALLDDPSFREGRYDCQFLSRKLEDPDFLRARPSRSELPLLAAGLALLSHETRSRTLDRPGAPRSTWRRESESGCWELEGS